MCLTVAGCGAVVLAGVGLAGHFVPVGRHLMVVIAVFAPYLMWMAPVALVLFVLARQLRLAVLALVVVLAVVWVQLPLYVADRGPSAAVQLRVLTANVYLGQADARTLVSTAERMADVVAMQELTADEVSRLTAAGMDRTFPYRVLDARDYASGAGVWSRYPLVESRRVDGYHMAVLTTRVVVDGVTPNPALLVAHLGAPWPQPIDDWQWDLGRMAGDMRAMAGLSGQPCVLVAGDFNSTLDMRPFRELLGIGYRDAADQAGAGLTATYPADRAVPMLALDHVLTRNCTATAASTFVIPGSDHRGLATTIAIPRAER